MKTGTDHVFPTDPDGTRLAYQERPEPHFLTYGPKTRREFLKLPPHS